MRRGQEHRNAALLLFAFLILSPNKLVLGRVFCFRKNIFEQFVSISILFVRFCPPIYLSHPASTRAELHVADWFAGRARMPVGARLLQKNGPKLFYDTKAPDQHADYMQRLLRQKALEAEDSGT